MAKKTTTKLPQKVIDYLEKAGIDHEVLEHKTVYTAIDAANTLKRKMGEIAKSLIVKADQDYFLVLLPADHNLDFNKLKKEISKSKGRDVKVVKIPGEKIVENALKVKAGTLTAFGNMHKVPVIIDKQLQKSKKAIFSAGSLNHSLEIAVNDFVNLENALLANFGIKKKIKAQAKTAPKKKKTVKKATVKPKKKVAKKPVKKIVKKKTTSKKKK